MARIIEGVREIKTLLLAHSAAVEAGEVVVVNSRVLIAINKAAINIMNVYAYDCRAAFPKADGVAIDTAVIVYYDATNDVVTDVGTGNLAMGFTIEDAAAADDEVVIDLCSFVVTPGA